MNAGAGRSQLLIQAFHASCNASSAKPGSSAQRTGIQRLLGCAIGAGKGAVSSGGSAGGGGGGVGVEQAASVPTISAVDTRRRSVDVMGLILLEALLALVLLLAIVW